MSTEVNKADPKRPYKAYVATAVAVLGLVWANLQGVEDWGTLDGQDWVTIVVPAVLVFFGTYAVKNPKVTDTALYQGERGAATVLGALGLGLIVLAILLTLAILFKIVTVSWIAVIVAFVIGVVLVALDNRNGRGVL